MATSGGDDWFQPDVLQGRPRAAVNAAFRADAARWSLQFSCADCAFATADLRCTHRFPNRALVQQPFEAVDSQGRSQLCKSFEANDG